MYHLHTGRLRWLLAGLVEYGSSFKYLRCPCLFWQAVLATPLFPNATGHIKLNPLRVACGMAPLERPSPSLLLAPGRRMVGWLRPLFFGNPAAGGFCTNKAQQGVEQGAETPMRPKQVCLLNMVCIPQNYINPPLAPHNPSETDF